MNKRKEHERAQWLAKFQDAVLELDDSHVGRINWDAGIYHYNQGFSIDDAAARYVESEKPVTRQY